MREILSMCCIVLTMTATTSGFAAQKFTKKAAIHNHIDDVKSYNKPYKIKGKRYVPFRVKKGFIQHGKASWYGYESGPKNAMGKKFNPKSLTAAHKTLPLPSKVKVTNLKNNRSVIVTITDRGPFIKGRVIDLSQKAAKIIGIKGISNVKLEVL